MFVSYYSTIVYTYVRFFLTTSDYLRSLVVWYTATKFKALDMVRGLIRNNELRFSKLKESHSHPDAAAERSAATRQMYDQFVSLGFEPVSVQMSSTESRKGKNGTLSYYWGTDLKAKARNDQGNAIVMTDVDYYVDINKELLKGQPVYLYTFVPKMAAKASGDFKWTFNKDGTVRARSSNGRGYNHALWNYDKDSYTVYNYGPWWISWLLRLFLFPLGYASFVCDRRYVSDHHSLVLFTPVSSGGFLSANFLAPLVPEERVERFNPIVKGENQTWVAFEVDGLEDRTTTVAEAGSSACSTLPSKAFDAATVHNGLTKLGVSPYSVSQSSDSNGGPSRLATTSAETVVAAAFIKDTQAAPKPVVPAGEFSAESAYHFVSDKPQAPPVEKLRSFMSPFTWTGEHPQSCDSNDQGMLHGRVIKPRSDAKLSSINRKFAVEFSEMIRDSVPDEAHIPQTPEYVSDKQPRPTQQRIIQDALFTGSGSDKTKCFQKSEAYNKVTYARNISTFAASPKLERSRVAYVATQILKYAMGSGYAGGITPSEIARKIADICSSSESVHVSDFSKMDGHISPAAREFEDVFLAIVFSIEIAARMKDSVPEKGFTTYGYWFWVGTSRSSGDPWTTFMNTLLYMFIVYASLRHAGYSKEQAFAHLRAKMAAMGDDGVVGDCPKTFEATCKAMGQVVTLDVVERGEFGVNFLSRFYGTGVWNGDTTSTCDLPRQLGKFHLTTNKTLSPEEILLNKCTSFALSDPYTPGIGVFCEKVFELAGCQDPIENNDEFDHAKWYQSSKDHVSWFAQYDFDSQYPNTGDVDSIVTHYFPHLNVGGFCDWVASCSTLDALLRPPRLCSQPLRDPPPFDAVVGGELVLGEQGRVNFDQASEKDAAVALRPSRGSSNQPGPKKGKGGDPKDSQGKKAPPKGSKPPDPKPEGPVDGKTRKKRRKSRKKKKRGDGSSPSKPGGSQQPGEKVSVEKHI
jgi:hypothetical protein